MTEAITLHLHPSHFGNATKLAQFYGPVASGLQALGARVNLIPFHRATAAETVAADLGFHILDLGSLRHPRVLNAGVAYVLPYRNLDVWGIKAASSLAEKPFDPSGIAPDLATMFAAGLRQRWVTERRSRGVQPTEKADLPKGAIAVFLQAEAHRGVGETCYLTMRQMIKALLDRADPRPILVKPHPRDKDAKTMDWLRQKARQDGRLRLVTANIHDMLAACDVVVTINSAVGVEAMMHRRPVVLCGHADFHHCATTLRTRSGMDTAIASAMVRDWPYDAFLYWYFALNCVAATSPDLAQDVLTKVAATGYDLALLGL